MVFQNNCCFFSSLHLDLEKMKENMWVFIDFVFLKRAEWRGRERNINVRAKTLINCLLHMLCRGVSLPPTQVEPAGFCTKDDAHQLTKWARTGSG